jgi:Asp-tRNA(Asn)/Glu-tRNA(Gln) amidotransferase C subunit|tara:strand:- start:1484 stop:1936 length:453 start_codon:yes stop_codon:yes gene_type:complete
MAKKQRGKKQPPTLKTQISSNLSKRANKLLEHYENIEALGRVGQSNSESSQLLNKLGDIFNTAEEVPKDTFSSKVEDILSKLKTLKQLVIYNIMCTEDKKNFDTDEYREDRMFVTDTVFKIHASNTVDKEDLVTMNKLYKKHKQVKQLFD